MTSPNPQEGGKHQAPATPELVERLRDLTRFMTGTPRSRAMLDAAAALEAQQARIAELEAELADAAIPSPYCEICGSCGSEGCGCEHKCKYAHSHPDVVRDMDALQALADRYEKLLREAAALFRFYETSHLAKKTQDGDEKAYRNAEIAGRIEAALSSQGRHEGGER